MEITITVTSKEMQFLEKMIAEMKTLGRQETTLTDAVHQCIAMAMYEESEEA